jgi:hypothetical protein
MESDPPLVYTENRLLKFIEKAKAKHGDKYNYSKVKLINNTQHIIIGCKLHGDFNQTPINHLNTNGCNKCGINARIGIKKTILRKDSKPFLKIFDEFIKKATEIHKDKYDYSKSNSTFENEKITIICKEHGEFTQTIKNHLNGHGCKECGKIKSNSCLVKPLSTEEFIRRSKDKHGNLYDYSNTIYLTSAEKVKILCKTHGEFELEPRKHYVLGYGCPICSGCGVSFAQLSWLQYIETTTNNEIIYKGGKYNKEETFRFNLKLYRVDGFCKETKTIYEFLGCWYHGCLRCRNENIIHPWSKKTMKQLYQECIDRKSIFEENGYKVIYMWECDWKKQNQ